MTRSGMASCAPTVGRHWVVTGAGASVRAKTKARRDTAESRTGTAMGSCASARRTGDRVYASLALALIAPGYAARVCMPGVGTAGGPESFTAADLRGSTAGVGVRLGRQDGTTLPCLSYQTAAQDL